MMNETKQIKKDVNILVGDSTAQLGKIEDDLSLAANKAKEDLTTWVEEGVSQIKVEVEKMTDEAKKSLASTAASVSTDVELQLRQYNTKIQEIVNRVPGDLGNKAVRYPWIAISIGVLSGLLMGFILKPSHRPNAR
jgi:F0F1-type ATP synthase membrane subunit b/b'